MDRIKLTDSDSSLSLSFAELQQYWASQDSVASFEAYDFDLAAVMESGVQEALATLDGYNADPLAADMLATLQSDGLAGISSSLYTAFDESREQIEAASMVG